MPGTVLIVEDCENTAAPLEIALEQMGTVEVLHLMSIHEALDFLANGRRPVVAIVTDLHLAQADAFELIEAVRRDQRYASLPIVVVSGDTHPETPERLARLGANAYFQKPYSPAEICQTLETLLDAD